MKLRLRSIQTKETLKFQVPTPCSLHQLKQILSNQIVSSPSSIHISLNCKDELPNQEPEESLQSLGIISGDLLFFSVSPNSVFSQTPSSQFAQQLQTLGSDTQNLGQKDGDLVVNLNTQKENTLKLDTHMGESLEVDTQKGETSIKLETLMGESLNMETHTGESSELMEVEVGDDNEEESVVDVGKSFSVPGFLRKVFMKELGGEGGDYHKLLIIAVHAVLLESGFVGFDPVSNSVINGFRTPEVWPLSAFKMSLWYTLPEIVGGDGCVKVDSVVLKFQNVGKFFNVYASLSAGSRAYGMRVNEDQLVPFLNVIWANCGSVGVSVGIGGGFSTTPEREVFAFWRNVKDKIALPLLIDLCEKAGFDLPPCFMRLPCDLKLQILMRLPGVDVAKVGCVCSELRYLTSNDDLWKQKCVEQFGDAARAEGGSLWKEKFAKALESRKRRRTAASSSFMGMRRDRNPFPGRFPGPFPRVIGGDYDILPPGFLNPLWKPDPSFPRLRNLMPHRNLGGLG